MAGRLLKAPGFTMRRVRAIGEGTMLPHARLPLSRILTVGPTATDVVAERGEEDVEIVRERRGSRR